jgi:hypothetical protein
MLFPYQRGHRPAGRAGSGAPPSWADCGMGKTPMQLEWAREVAAHTKAATVLDPGPAGRRAADRARGVEVRPVRHLRPLAGRGRAARHLRHQLRDAAPLRPEGLRRRRARRVEILKAYDGATRTAIIEAFRDTRFKLAATATPAPNDYMELGNHAEFLGVMSRVEMLATFFVHDGGATSEWRLKGHAEEEFWKWVTSWAVMLRKPSDLGYSDDGFTLPPLEIEHLRVEANQSTANKAGLLFAMEAQHAGRAPRRPEGVGRRTASSRGGPPGATPAPSPGCSGATTTTEGDALERGHPRQPSRWPARTPPRPRRSG